MKKIIVLFVLVFLAVGIFAQDKEDKKKGVGRLDQSDRVIVDIFTDFWMKVPDDSMSMNGFNRGTNVYLMRDLPLGKSNFSFAAGAGIGVHNMYSDASVEREIVTDTTATYGYIYTGNTVFKPIPATNVIGGEVSFKNNKLTVAYVEIPVEFRYRTRNNAFKFALGFKGGITIGSHTKYVGDDYLNILDPDGTIRIKQHKIPNIQTYRYGVYLRTGWKWISVYGYYSLTHLFKKDKGPDMYPISVGVSITPL